MKQFFLIFGIGTALLGLFLSSAMLIFGPGSAAYMHTGTEEQEALMAGGAMAVFFAILLWAFIKYFSKRTVLLVIFLSLAVLGGLFAGFMLYVMNG